MGPTLLGKEACETNLKCREGLGDPHQGQGLCGWATPTGAAKTPATLTAARAAPPASPAGHQSLGAGSPAEAHRAEGRPTVQGPDPPPLLLPLTRDPCPMPWPTPATVCTGT